jgi:hypothetical protein
MEAEMARKTMISQLASVGEEALGQLAANPVTRRALEGAMQVKDRVEKLVSGVSDLEKRVATLEKKLASLEKPKKATAAKPRSTTKKTS